MLAFGPAAYTVYMFLQYILGPEYGVHAAVVLFQLAIFTLGGALAVWAWTVADDRLLPVLTRHRERAYGAALLVIAAFVVSRYFGAIAARGAASRRQAHGRNRAAHSAPTRADRDVIDGRPSTPVVDRDLQLDY